MRFATFQKGTFLWPFCVTLHTHTLPNFAYRHIIIDTNDYDMECIRRCFHLCCVAKMSGNTDQGSYLRAGGKLDRSNSQWMRHCDI